MSIKTVAIDIGILLLVASVAGGAGYLRGHDAGVDKGNAKVLDAQQATSDERARTNVAVQALRELHARLDAQKRDLQAQQAVAAAALAARDAAQTQLAQATRDRIAADRKAAHEDPSCSDLEHLPVCPVLARRLWPGAPQAGAAAAAAASH